MSPTAIVSWSVSYPPQLCSVQVHRPQLQISTASTCEYDLLTIRRNSGFSVITLLFGQLGEVPCPQIQTIDVHALVHWPHITIAHIWSG